MASWWDRRLKYPKYWHLEALAGLLCVFYAGLVSGKRRWFEVAVWLAVAAFWLTLAARGMKRRE